MDAISSLMSLGSRSGDLPGVPSGPPDEAAKQLEGMFMSLLLKEMRQTLDEEGGLFPGDSGDVQGGLFDLYLSRHLADNGGVGMATAAVGQLQHHPAVIAVGHGPGRHHVQITQGHGLGHREQRV